MKKSYNTVEEEKFFEVCINGNLSQIKILLTHQPSMINCRTQYGHTGLMHSCFNGHLDVVKYLLTSKDLKVHTNINATNKNYDTALSFAAYHGHMDIVRYLLTSPELEIHADINRNNDRALREAVVGVGDIEMIKYLLTSSELTIHANPYSENEFGENSFRLSYNVNAYDYIGFLLYDYGFKITEKEKKLLDDEDIQTALNEYQKIKLKEKIEKQLDKKEVHPNSSKFKI